MKTKNPIQCRYWNVHWTQHAKKKYQRGIDAHTGKYCSLCDQLPRNMYKCTFPM